MTKNVEIGVKHQIKQKQKIERLSFSYQVWRKQFREETVKQLTEHLLK